MSSGGNTRPLKIFIAAMGMIAFALMFTPTIVEAATIEVAMVAKEIPGDNTIWEPIDTDSNKFLKLKALIR